MASSAGLDGGRYVRYTPEQLDALERVYNECPKPSSTRRQQLISECPVLSNIEPKSIKVWFQNRRCREKQRKETTKLSCLNAKLTALNKLLVEENERLTKHTSQLVAENGLLRQKLLAATQGQSRGGLLEEGSARSQSSALTLRTEDGAGPAGPLSVKAAEAQAGPSSPSGLLVIAESMLSEFLAKATGTALDWVQAPGLKAGGESGMVAIAMGCQGVATRVCSWLALAPLRAAELLKAKGTWLRSCRRCDVMGGFRTSEGGVVELLYWQLYAPTTLAPPRDFCTLRYTSMLADGGIVICERSLSGAQGGASMPPVSSFVRAEMLTSGAVIRPCEGGNSVVIVVDHMDLEASTVPEVLRPLYTSSAALAHAHTLPALRFLCQAAAEGTQEGAATQSSPAAWRPTAERLASGFNKAVNSFSDDGWVVLPSDGMDDVTVAARPAVRGGQEEGSSAPGSGVLCARASMLLQVVPPSTLVRFLRGHRSEWADTDIDTSTATAIQASMQGGLPRGSATATQGFSGSVANESPLAVAMDEVEFLELVKLEQRRSPQAFGADTFLLQLCTTPDEASAAPAQLVFAPVDASSAADSVPLLPSGFRVLPVDKDDSVALDLRAAAAKASTSGRPRGEDSSGGPLPGTTWRSVLTIAFQFAYEAHSQEAVAAVARQYVRSVVASVQRVAMSLVPACLNPPRPPSRPHPRSPEELLLARRVLASYRLCLGVDLGNAVDGSAEELCNTFWTHPDAIVCCVWKAIPEFIFGNRAGLDMFEATVESLKILDWNRTLNEESKKATNAAFSQVLQLGYSLLPPGVRMSTRGRVVAYQRALAWKVLDDDDNMQCIALMFANCEVVNL